MSKQPSWLSTVRSTVMASGLAGLRGRGWHMSHCSLGWCRHRHKYLAPRAPAIPTLVHSSSWEMGVTEKRDLELVIVPWMGAGTVLRYQQITWPCREAAGSEVDGSAVSVQVLCSVECGVARRGNVPSSCKHGTWRTSSLYPSELRGPAGARARLWHTAGTSHSSSPVSRKL